MPDTVACRNPPAMPHSPARTRETAGEEDERMGHVLWFSPTLADAATGGVTVQTFITQMVTDDTAWTSVH